MKRLQQQGGYALITVLSVLAILIIYLVTVQSAITMTHRNGKINATRQDLNEAATALMAMALMGNEPTSQTLVAPNGLKAHVQRTPLAPTDELWSRLPALAARPGDALLTLTWQEGTRPGATERFIINSQGQRPGAISLGGLATTAVPGRPATPAATSQQEAVKKQS